MSKVAEFINCIIDGKEYNNKAKWEIIDFFIIGSQVFLFGLLGLVMIQ